MRRLFLAAAVVPTALAGCAATQTVKSELAVAAPTATVLVECKPLPDGGLTECVVVEENPPGQGFGQAALDMAKRGRLDATRTSIGDKVRFTVHFRPEM